MNFSSIEECLIKRMHVETSLEPVRTLSQYGPFYLQRYKGVTYIRNDFIKLRDKDLLIIVRDALRKELYDAL